jgi:hypothetical protein
VLSIQYVEEKSFCEEKYALYFTNTGVDSGSFPFTIYRKLASEVLHSIKVYPISNFLECDNRTVLLDFVILSEEKIQEAVQLLAKAWFLEGNNG